MGEELLLPEKKRESLEEFEARRELGHKYAAEEQQMFEEFCASFPLPN
jgi:hypothetical protein